MRLWCPFVDLISSRKEEERQHHPKEEGGSTTTPDKKGGKAAPPREIAAPLQRRMGKQHCQKGGCERNAAKREEERPLHFAFLDCPKRFSTLTFNLFTFLTCLTFSTFFSHCSLLTFEF